MEAILERVQRSALRLMLTIASINAIVLVALAIAEHAGRSPLRTVVAGVLAAAVAVVPRARGHRFYTDLAEARWLPSAGAAVGVGVLTLAPESRSILFAALLTPVGVAVLADDRREALNATLLLSLGYLIAAMEPDAGSTLGVAIGDISPAFAVILGGLIPAALAARAITTRSAAVAQWRDPATLTPPGRRPGRPGISADHDRAILQAVKAGVPDKTIASERGLRTWQIRDRIKALAHDRGVDGRRGLTRLLNELERPDTLQPRR
jgi:hypothetical protein